MYKIGYDSRNNTYQVYEGLKNKAIIYFGTQKECFVFIEFLKMSQGLNIQSIEKWISENSDLIESLNFDDLSTLVNIKGWIETKNIQNQQKKLRMGKDLNLLLKENKGE